MVVGWLSACWRICVQNVQEQCFKLLMQGCWRMPRNCRLLPRLLPLPAAPAAAQVTLTDLKMRCSSCSEE